MNGKQIGMYLNLEAQSDYYPGYPIEPRGIYYAARRLTAQLKKIDKDTNYGALQKVLFGKLNTASSVTLK